MEPVFLSLDDVLEVHEQQIERYGGSSGLRMRRPYLFHLCQNHAFIDGNKRVGANAAITFLLMNDWEPTFEPDELVELVLSVASGRLNKQRLTEIFESRSKPRGQA